jgi:regulator of sigma E protease
MASIIAAILAIGILIILHEAGHYFAAKWSGMRVRRFSIGFGPALAKVVRRGTEFRIGALPLGGYVQIDGMSPQDGSDPSSPDNYMAKPVHVRAATIFAGPFANYLLGFVLLALFYAFFYIVELAPLRVVEVVDDSPAAKAGLLKGDLIIGTSSAAFAGTEDLLEAIKNSGGALSLAVEREGEKKTILLQPEAVDGGGMRIGIAYEATRHEMRPLGFSPGVGAALTHVWQTSVNQLKGLASLIRGASGTKLSGPVGMVKGLARRAEMSWAAALASVADLSVMLGLLNLLPIPALDGSRLMFLILGLIRRKPIDSRVEAVVHFAGFVLLLLLLVGVSLGEVLE